MQKLTMVHRFRDEARFKILLLGFTITLACNIGPRDAYLLGNTYKSSVIAAVDLNDVTLRRMDQVCFVAHQIPHRNPPASLSGGELIILPWLTRVRILNKDAARTIGGRFTLMSVEVASGTYEKQTIYVCDKNYSLVRTPL